MSAPASGYKFGRKNNWRRTVWNQIKERITVPAKDAVVVYLAGPENLDRKEALRRGFSERNLIAVDAKRTTVHRLRETTQLAIHADFFDVLNSWNCSRDIDVVFGDFCCGLTGRLVNEVCSLTRHPSLLHAVFAFNVLRGRDPLGAELGALLASHVEIVGGGVAQKHRGITLYMHAALKLAADVRDRADLPPDDDEKFGRRFHYLNARADAYFESYMSTSGQVFDSVVWSSALRGLMTLSSEKRRKLNSLFAKDRPETVPVTRRKIAATLAHRTMRAAA